MNPRSKTHHYLPQLVLRGFADDEQIQTYDLLQSRSFVQPIRRAAAENNYNTVETRQGEPSDELEKLLSVEFEGPAAALLERIARGGWIVDEFERFQLARFLVLQYLRVPSRRLELNAQTDWLAKLDIAAKGPEGLRDAVSKALGRSATDDEIAEAWSFFSNFDDYEIGHAAEHLAVETVSMVDEFAPTMMSAYSWSVMRWTRRSLLTSDSPVVLVQHPSSEAWQGVGLYTAGVIMFAIDRRTALVLLNRSHVGELRSHEVSGTFNSARDLNHATVASARRFIFHHPADEPASLVGPTFDWPQPGRVDFETSNSNELRSMLASMSETHFADPDQPHPMSGESSPPSVPNADRDGG